MRELYLLLEQTNISIEQWIRIFYIVGCVICAPMALVSIVWFWKMTLAVSAKQAKKMLRKSTQVPIVESYAETLKSPKAPGNIQKEPERPEVPLVVRIIPPQAEKLLADVDAKISLDYGWTGSIMEQIAQ